MRVAHNIFWEDDKMGVMLIILGVTLVCIFGLLIFTFIRTRNYNNKNCKSVINHFEPKNVAPELTEMIEYHKNNETVDYEL